MYSAVVLWALVAANPTADALSIEPLDDATRVRVVARLSRDALAELDEGPVESEIGQRWLAFSLVDDAGSAGPPIFGKHARRGDRLTFVPRHRLVPSQRYRAVLHFPAGKTAVLEYRLPPRSASERATVEKVYPSADVLPANHLKFYIYFSQPMREGRAIFDRIKLLDEVGEPVHDAWRRTELWTPDARRLTLWIHPGRVKQGVDLREEFGPVLNPGRNYSLVITADVQDAVGQPLAAAFKKTFKTAAADHSRPLPEEWKLTLPRAGTSQAVWLELNKPLDHALLQRLLTVRDADGEVVPGKIAIQDKESIWWFRPDDPWRPASYTIDVDPLLEDLAGNTPLRVFDTDLTQPPAKPLRLKLSFRPSADSQ